MEEYYRQLAEKGRADSYKTNVSIFQIGDGDRLQYPELLLAWQLWIYSWGGYYIVDIKNVIGRGLWTSPNYRLY